MKILHLLILKINFYKLFYWLKTYTERYCDKMVHWKQYSPCDLSSTGRHDVRNLPYGCFTSAGSISREFQRLVVDHGLYKETQSLSPSPGSTSIFWTLSQSFLTSNKNIENFMLNVKISTSNRGQKKHWNFKISKLIITWKLMS